jgi:hypothetical protein
LIYVTAISPKILTDPPFIIIFFHSHYTRLCPKVSGLAAWSENCKWYSSLQLGAVVSLFYELV